MALDRDILSEAVKPVNYDLSIYGLELGGAFSYKGTVCIDIDIKKPTSVITLNAHQLQIQTAKVTTDQNESESGVKPSDTSYDEKKQRISFHFKDDLPPTSKAALTIEFTGTMNNHMAGFYRSKYRPTVSPAASVPQDAEGNHLMFSTQFESCDARRAFPCFDELNLKASYDFSIEIPEDQTALSNMPERATKSGSRSGLKVVSFERTPVMSTYLLAWAFGDFEYVEDQTRKVKYNGKFLPVRVYTTRGLKEQGRFALKNAHQIVDYFSEIFRIDYPLPKADLLAVHEFSHGAMENWGLVTYRTTAVLFDEEKSDQKYKNRVAYVVAHELAHQWFGNLVTMDWWSELWLNEGFATWVGWLAIDHLYPEWNVWGQFVTEGMQTAFSLDALRSSHPIEVPVKDALEIDQIFDHISYLKGSSVIRMLAAHLGQDTFLLGVSNYLKAHEYGNATTKDLWDALSAASGENVNDFMDVWIRKIGFPVVTVAEEPGQIGVRQSRFLTTGDVKPEEDQTLWWIPLGLKTGARQHSNAAGALTTKEETIRDIDDDFYKINADNTGFYRTNYPPERLARLGNAREKLTVEDKVGLVGDAAAIAVSGDGTTAGLLAFVEGFKDETNYLVWSQVTSSLSNLRSIFATNEEVSASLQKFTLQLVAPQTEKVGWDFPADEEFLTAQLRSLLIATAGLAGHQSTITQAQERFQKYFGGEEKAVHPNLRSAVFRIAITHGGKSEYEAVKDFFKTTTSIDGKEIALQSMGRVQSSDLAQDFLDFLFRDVPVQDMHSGASSLALNPKTRYILWDYIKSNWTDVRSKLGGNMVVLDRFLKLGLSKFADLETERNIASFFKDKDNSGYDRTLGVLSDTITANARYRERDEGIVAEWLAAHGYV